MEGAEPTTRERTTRQDGSQEEDPKVLLSSKPLHRFVRKEPRSLGIVILIFGCAELLMGFNLASESMCSSYTIYIPFWQGVLFLVCGNLSIYTEIHPSKKMVTVCLAMYVVSLLGIVVSIGYRLHCFFFYNFYILNNSSALYGVEGLLFISSICVSVLLIFLSVAARLSLKSTQTQVIVQCMPGPPPPQNNTTPN